MVIKTLYLVILVTVVGLAFSFFAVHRSAMLFFAIPITGGTSISAHMAESLNDHRFLTADENSFMDVTSEVLLTYEKRQSGNINALNVNRTVQLVGTNHTYPFVMGKQMIHGRFFSRDALVYRHQVAVLNEIAAFEFFGTTQASGNRLEINGDIYSVAGVIADGNENAMVYVPATIIGGQIEALAANLAFNTEEHIVNVWRQLGIIDTHYDFVNLGTIRQVIQDRLWLALISLAMGSVAFGLRWFVKFAVRKWHELQLLRREIYNKEVIRTAVAWTLLFSWVMVAVLAGVILFLGLDAFDRMLIAYDSVGMLSQISTNSFAAVISQMVRWNNISLVLFFGFIVAYVLSILGKMKM